MPEVFDIPSRDESNGRQIILDGREWVMLTLSSSLIDSGDDGHCQPVVLSLPSVDKEGGERELGGQLFQVYGTRFELVPATMHGGQNAQQIDGQVAGGEVGAARLLPMVGSEILREGATIKHTNGWLFYRSMEVSQCEANGPGHCVDVFSISLPCLAGSPEVSRNTLWIRLLEHIMRLTVTLRSTMYPFLNARTSFRQ